MVLVAQLLDFKCLDSIPVAFRIVFDALFATTGAYARRNSIEIGRGSYVVNVAIFPVFFVPHNLVLVVAEQHMQR